MTKEQKDWIDNTTLELLLSKWRFSTMGDPWFQGECGTYYSSVMNEKRNADPEAWTTASKRVGWER